jgi:hypothetical protein
MIEESTWYNLSFADYVRALEGRASAGKAADWALILQLVIVLTLQLLFPKLKFFKTMHPF